MMDVTGFKRKRVLIFDSHTPIIWLLVVGGGYCFFPGVIDMPEKCNFTNLLCNESRLLKEDKIIILNIGNELRNRVAGGTFKYLNLQHDPIADMNKLYWNEEIANKATMIVSRCPSSSESFIDSQTAIESGENAIDRIIIGDSIDPATYQPDHEIPGCEVSSITYVEKLTQCAAQKIKERVIRFLSEYGLSLEGRQYDIRDFWIVNRYGEPKLTFRRHDSSQLGCSFMIRHSKTHYHAYLTCIHCSFNASLPTIGHPGENCPMKLSTLDSKYENLCSDSRSEYNNIEDDQSSVACNDEKYSSTDSDSFSTGTTDIGTSGSSISKEDEMKNGDNTTVPGDLESIRVGQQTTLSSGQFQSVITSSCKTTIVGQNKSQTGAPPLILPKSITVVSQNTVSSDLSPSYEVQTEVGSATEISSTKKFDKTEPISTIVKGGRLTEISSENLISVTIASTFKITNTPTAIERETSSTEEPRTSVYGLTASHSTFGIADLKTITDIAEQKEITSGKQLVNTSSSEYISDNSDLPVSTTESLFTKLSTIITSTKRSVISSLSVASLTEITTSNLLFTSEPTLLSTTETILPSKVLFTPLNTLKADFVTACKTTYIPSNKTNDARTYTHVSSASSVSVRTQPSLTTSSFMTTPALLTTNKFVDLSTNEKQELEISTQKIKTTMKFDLTTRKFMTRKKPPNFSIETFSTLTPLTNTPAYTQSLAPVSLVSALSKQTFTIPITTTCRTTVAYTSTLPSTVTCKTTISAIEYSSTKATCRITILGSDLTQPPSTTTYKTTATSPSTTYKTTMSILKLLTKTLPISYTDLIQQVSTETVVPTTTTCKTTISIVSTLNIQSSTTDIIPTTTCRTTVSTTKSMTEQWSQQPSIPTTSCQTTLVESSLPAISSSTCKTTINYRQSVSVPSSSLVIASLSSEAVKIELEPTRSTPTLKFQEATILSHKITVPPMLISVITTTPKISTLDSSFLPASTTCRTTTLFESTLPTIHSAALTDLNSSMMFNKKLSTVERLPTSYTLSSTIIVPTGTCRTTGTEMGSHITGTVQVTTTISAYPLTHTCKTTYIDRLSASKMKVQGTPLKEKQIDIIDTTILPFSTVCKIDCTTESADILIKTDSRILTVTLSTISEPHFFTEVTETYLTSKSNLLSSKLQMYTPVTTTCKTITSDYSVTTCKTIISSIETATSTCKTTSISKITFPPITTNRVFISLHSTDTTSKSTVPIALFPSTTTSKTTFPSSNISFILNSKIYASTPSSSTIFSMEQLSTITTCRTTVATLPQTQTNTCKTIIPTLLPTIISSTTCRSTVLTTYRSISTCKTITSTCKTTIPTTFPTTSICKTTVPTDFPIISRLTFSTLLPISNQTVSSLAVSSSVNSSQVSPFSSSMGFLSSFTSSSSVSKDCNNTCKTTVVFKSEYPESTLSEVTTPSFLTSSKSRNAKISSVPINTTTTFGEVAYKSDVIPISTSVSLTEGLPSRLSTFISSLLPSDWRSYPSSTQQNSVTSTSLSSFAQRKDMTGTIKSSPFSLSVLPRNTFSIDTVGHRFTSMVTTPTTSTFVTDIAGYIISSPLSTHQSQTTLQTSAIPTISRIMNKSHRGSTLAYTNIFSETAAVFSTIYSTPPCRSTAMNGTGGTCSLTTTFGIETLIPNVTITESKNDAFNSRNTTVPLSKSKPCLCINWYLICLIFTIAFIFAWCLLCWQKMLL